MFSDSNPPPPGRNFKTRRLRFEFKTVSFRSLVTYQFNAKFLFVFSNYRFCKSSQRFHKIELKITTVFQFASQVTMDGRQVDFSTSSGLADPVFEAHINGNDVLLQVRIERFSIECRKTKTKVIALANHKGHKQDSEPIKTSK